jgi:hypothetical protein
MITLYSLFNIMEKLILKATTRINSEDKTVYIEYRIENE